MSKEKKIVITVKETVEKLKEKNPNPRKIYNRAELTTLVQAILSDSEYVTKNTSIKSGELVTDERNLSAEFKKALTDILRTMGLNQQEAVEAVENYKVPKSLAAAMIDVTHAADHLYMKEVGKGIKFIGESDVDQTIFFREVGEREHRIPKTDKNPNPEFSKVKVQPHGRLAISTKTNPRLKSLLK